MSSVYIISNQEKFILNVLRLSLYCLFTNDIEVRQLKKYFGIWFKEPAVLFHSELSMESANIIVVFIHKNVVKF